MDFVVYSADASSSYSIGNSTVDDGDDDKEFCNITPDEKDTLLAILAATSVASVVLGSFVILTFMLFEEKRRNTTSLLVFYYAIASTLLDANMVVVAFFQQELETNTALCIFQGGSLVFLGNAFAITTFSVAVNLYARLHKNRDVLTHVQYAVVILVYSTILSIPPLAMNIIEKRCIYCFIAHEQLAVTFSCFYTGMILSFIVGGLLFMSVLSQLVRSIIQDYRLRKQKEKDAETNEKEPLNSSRVSFSGSSDAVPKVGRVTTGTKVFVLTRQIIFSFGITAALLLVIGEGFWSDVLEERPGYGWWVAYVLCLGSFGLYAFIVFGITEPNIYLWKSFCLRMVGALRCSGADTDDDDNGERYVETIRSSADYSSSSSIGNSNRKKTSDPPPPLEDSTTITPNNGSVI